MWFPFKTGPEKKLIASTLFTAKGPRWFLLLKLNWAPQESCSWLNGNSNLSPQTAKHQCLFPHFERKWAVHVCVCSCVCVYCMQPQAQSSPVDGAPDPEVSDHFSKLHFSPSTRLMAVSQALWFIKQKRSLGSQELIVSAYIWCCSAVLALFVTYVFTWLLSVIGAKEKGGTYMKWFRAMLKLR